VISDDQLLRYNRQIMLPQMDVAGQEKLLAAKVLIVGMGGLGCPVSLYLAAAGVGELILADGDSVDMSNLQRQIAHTETDIGRAKVDSVADSIAAINSDIVVQRVARHVRGDELRQLVDAVDLVVDATDNFSTRLEINLTCVELSKPLVSGAAIRSEGQVLVIDSAAGTPCYHCAYPQAQADEDLSCSESGVLAPMVGVIGSLQALEAVKLLAGYGEPLRGQLLLIDGWSLQVRRIKLKKNPQCPHCSPHRAAADD
jgi:molybdopterin/thiamine biosynthesis adenylyltransferase